MSEQTNMGWEGIIPFLLKAQQAVEAVGKASKNDFGGYKYASAEDMITASREVLHKNGLIVTRNGWRLLGHGDEDSWSTPVVEAVYILAHRDGHSVVCATQYPVCEGKGRPADKALNAALTTGLSYFLRDLLLIPRCDVEVDQRPDTISRAGGTRKTPKPSPVTKSSVGNKQKFMGLVASWINRDVSEKIVAQTCINILELNSLPTDGTATATQFKDMCAWVDEQVSNKVDPADVIQSPVPGSA